MFLVMSQLSENFVFIYLGITLFTFGNHDINYMLVFICLISMMAARYFSVIPLAELINYFSPNPLGRPKIPRKNQLMIWWAGIRGAIPFALSFEVGGLNQSAIQSAILIVCVVSIIVFGGSTVFALKYLEIQTGELSDVRNFADGEYLLQQQSPDSNLMDETNPSHWFLSFDSKFLKPLFCRKLKPVEVIKMQPQTR